MQLKQSAEPTQTEDEIYKIRQGDTLGKIALEHLGDGATIHDIYNYVEQIARHNHIANSDKIYADRHLYILPFVQISQKKQEHQENKTSIEEKQSAGDPVNTIRQPGGKSESSQIPDSSDIRKPLIENAPAETDRNVAASGGDDRQENVEQAASSTTSKPVLTIDRNVLEKDAEAILAATGNDNSIFRWAQQFSM